MEERGDVRSPGVAARSGDGISGLLRWMSRRVHGFYATAGVLLSVGLLLALLGLWGLSVLTEEMLEGDTANFDRHVLVWMNEHATPLLDEIAIQITALGETSVVILVVVIAASLLWLFERSAYAWMLTLAVGGGAIITPVLKTIFDRPRPRVFEWRADFGDMSAAYPSGHATLSMVTLVTFAFILHRIAPARWPGPFAMVVAGILVLLIGASRLYLGLHHPSDVLAGYVVGFAWAVLCAFTVESLQRRWTTPVDRPEPVRGERPLDEIS